MWTVHDADGNEDEDDNDDDFDDDVDDGKQWYGGVGIGNEKTTMMMMMMMMMMGNWDKSRSDDKVAF